MWVVFINYIQIFHNRDNAVQFLTKILCMLLFLKREKNPVLTEEEEIIKKNIYDELNNDENEESDTFNNLYHERRHKSFNHKIIEMDYQDDDEEFGYVLK
jgi:hypothetical protein